MPPEAVIVAEGLSKSYRVRGSPALQLAARLGLAGRNERPFRAVDSASFRIGRGETVGIIGRNGAGKSTLLQLVCGLLEPSAGSVRVAGRIAGLLELGAGFDPEFSGRENVGVAAAVMGLSEAQIAERFASIEAFAGIGDFIDRPVREYSSGMFARLAFSVCIHVDADILVVDEILSVGDAAFQKKCMRELERFAASGGTVLFVSHDEGAVIGHCQRAIWLEGGRIRADGPSAEVCRDYAQALPPDGGGGNNGDAGATAAAAAGGAGPQRFPPLVEVDPERSAANPITLIHPPLADAPWHGEGGAHIVEVGLATPDGAPLAALHGGDEVVLRIACVADRAVERPIVGYILRNPRGENLAGDNTYLRYRGENLAMAAGERFVASFRLRLPLLPAGDHFIAPSIIEGTQTAHVHLHWIEDALCLRVERSPVAVGAIGLAARAVSIEPLPQG